MIGTPRMNSGMNSGAKKKYTCPLKGSFWLPPTEIVDAAISSPSRSAPPSPMKIFAGLKLWGRKPRQMPRVMMATSGPMLFSLMTPASTNCSL